MDYFCLSKLSIFCYTVVNNFRNACMKTITVTEAKEQIEALVNDANDNHQPILLSGTAGNAILIAEEDWNSIQETLYLYSIPGMVPSIIEGGNTAIEDCVGEETIRDILNG